MNKRFLTLSLVVGILCAALGLYFANARYQAKPVADGAVQSLMKLNLKDSQGQSQPMQQWAGKTLILNFWATWCKPCVQEMPELVDLQKEFSDKNIQLLGIGIDSPSNISEFAKQYQITYPLFAAGMEGTQLSASLGNKAGGLPYTVLISGDGQILKTYFGRIKINDLRADALTLPKKN